MTKAEIKTKVTGSGVVAVTNWHLLAGVEDPDFVPGEDISGADIDANAAMKSFFPVRPGKTAGNNLNALASKFTSGKPLLWLKDLSSLMVFNNEAHHIHTVKKGGQVDEVEWQKSLTDIASTKSGRFIQVDFSTTPFNESGSEAKKSRKWSPHIVVDFDLGQAMSLGLVKDLALDKRKEVANLPLDFNAERDGRGRVVGMSPGQRVMLRAGLTKLAMVEQEFSAVDPDKHPKQLIMYEETAVTRHVEEILHVEGLSAEDVLVVDSDRKGEMTPAERDAVRERLTPNEADL